MIIRTKETQSNEEKGIIPQEILDYAKNVISLDIQDSFSWYIYCNAFFL